MLATWLFFLILLEFVVLIFSIGVLAFLCAWLLSAYLDVPFVPTPYKAFPIIADALEIKEGDVVYELGSGDGRFILWCARRNANAQFIGIERNAILHVYTLARKRLAGNPPNLIYRRGDLFKTDLQDATKVYAYLLNSVMAKLAPKFDAELRNARLASRAFILASKKPSTVIELSKKPGKHGEHMLYVYDF
jgi:SAM-dependent methyltransferase